MKILIFNEYYYPYERGGAEVSTRLLAESLCRLGHEIFIVTTCDRNYEMIHNGVNVFYIKANPIYWDGNCKAKTIAKKILWHIVDMNNPFILPFIDSIINKISPDVIHTNNLSHFSCSVWKIAKKRNIPICHTLRDYYLLCHKCTLYNHDEVCKQRCLPCRISSFFKAQYSRYVNTVVGISNHILLRHLQEGFFDNVSEKQVIFNPVSNDKIINRKDQNNKIGFIGSLKASKGIEFLIKSFLSCKREDYTLLVAGKGDSEYENHLRSICAHAINIEFLGRMEPKTFYNQIGLLVVPSLWEEPFGRIVVEAIACGVPVLASNQGGISEILKDRKEGTLFNIDDENSLKNKLLEYMDGKMCFDFSTTESFLEKFGLNYIASEYDKLYVKIKRGGRECQNTLL